MEFHLPISTTAMAGMLTFLLLFYYLLIIKSPKRKRTAPEAGGAWPVIGHLHLLGGTAELPHRTLGTMADKYGPVFLIKMGLQRALVVSNWEMAKECLTTNDKTFANRPKSIAVEVLGYNYAMFGFGPYGSYWNQMRKIVTLELLSKSRLEILKHVWVSELKASVQELFTLWVNKRSDSNTVLVEMKDWFGDRSFNMVLRILIGTNLSDKEERMRCQKLVRDFFQLMGKSVAADAFPFLRWLDLGGYERAMKKTANELDCVLESWLQKHKSKRMSGQADGKQNFMDVMLSILDDEDKAQNPRCFDADTVNKATCLTILAGGTDTVTVTLTWALSLLLNNREVLKKVGEELDLHVGRERQVEEWDIKNLVYLNAVIKETMRLYPAGRFLGHHESMDDCLLGGYHVPAGTRLLVNLWKLHRDPSVWPDPDAFRPERFLSTHKDVDVKGKHFEFIPFGSGRRGCPGISLALQFMQFTLASLIHGFEFATTSSEPIDMTESIGLTNPKATPLELLLAPRLSSNLYA